MFNKVGAEGLFNQKCPEEMEKGSQFGLMSNTFCHNGVSLLFGPNGDKKM